MIPASDAEISTALHQLGAVEIEGKLRVLSKYVLFDAMKALLQSMVALDLLWAEDGLLVSEDEGYRLLSSGGGESTPSSSSSIVDPHVLRGCLDLLGSSYCTVEADPRTRTWKLDALEVSRMTAHLVLQEGEVEEEGRQQRRKGSTSCFVDVSIAGRDRCSYTVCELRGRHANARTHGVLADVTVLERNADRLLHRHDRVEDLALLAA